MTTFLGHTRLVIVRAFRDFDLGKDMFIGAIIAALTLGFQVVWELIPLRDWQEHRWQWTASVILPFVAVFAIDALRRIICAPWRLHQDQEEQIRELETFKKTIESPNVHLELIRCYVQPITYKFGNGNSDMGLTLRAVFANPIKPGAPGKPARQVAARIMFRDACDNEVRIDGRWAQSDQPETVSPLHSILHLLHIDFGVGSELELDLVAKFPNDYARTCYAVDNRSFPHIREDRTLLQGPHINARIELMAEHVNQKFEVKFASDFVNLAPVSHREIYTAS